MDPYNAIDWLYDLEHQDFDDDFELILGLAETIEGPILELGCGSGRVLVPLASRGYDVTGLDSSPAMLERARTALKNLPADSGASTATLVQGDMRKPGELPNSPFGLAIYSLNGFMHLPSQAEQIESLQSVCGVLRTGGVVVFDLMNPAPDYLEKISGATVLEWQNSIDEDGTVQKWAHREVDPVEQVIATSIWYDLTDASGALRRVHTSFPLRYVHSSELRLMLEMAGFGDISVFGSYALDEYDGHAERLIVIAEKTA